MSSRAHQSGLPAFRRTVNPLPTIWKAGGRRFESSGAHQSSIEPNPNNPPMNFDSEQRLAAAAIREHDVDTKHLNFEFADTKELHEDGEFEGHASIFGDEDFGKDVVAPGAFRKTLREHKKSKRMPAMLWQHNTGMPVGVWLEIKEDQKGLFGRGKLLLNVGLAKDVHEFLKPKAESRSWRLQRLS